MYVPLFFYIFDRLAERSAEKKKKVKSDETPPPTAHGEKTEGA
jgi:hypothetical protein